MAIVKSNIDQVDKTLDALYLFFTDKLLDNLAIALERRVKLEITNVGLVDTGRLRTSISGRRVGAFKFLVSDGVTYGVYHELGTGIYGPKARFIVPINKKALHWEKTTSSKTSSGRTKRITTSMFATKVKGVKKKAPFYKAMLSFEEDIDKEMKRATRNMMK